jgi:glycosyltransferase involved in cell wall biosynthesis
MEKKKLMWIGDYSNTGFGTVAKGLLRGLHDTGKYEIFQLGINWSDEQEFPDPWKIASAGWHRIDPGTGTVVADDSYGAIKADIWVERFDPDIVIINNDYPIGKSYLRTKGGKETKLAKHRSFKILYSPIDSEPAPKVYAEIAAMFDLNIAYTEFQRGLMAQLDPMYQLMPVLYHGYDDKVMVPMDKTEAKDKLVDIFHKYMPEQKREDLEERFRGKYLVYFVGRNQFRKDLPCLFRAFALFRDDVENAYLVPHTNVVPHGNSGWVLTNLAELTELPEGSAALMGEANMFTEAEMNIFYNAADVLAYPTWGEGFGLPSFEAMGVKTPVIATNFGPQREIHRQGRGYFIDIRDVIPADFAGWSYFALPDHRSLYKQLKFVHDNPEHVAETVERAYEFVKDFSWSNQAKRLDEILDKLPEKESNDVLVQTA